VFIKRVIMRSNQFLKAAILTVALLAIFTASWELYWRNRGFDSTRNDDKILWAAKRKEVYKPADQATVFIGPSRIKFDLDVPTWERLTGEKAIQLAIVGTSCRPILNDLAKDEKFKGKLIIDATEFTLFSGLARRDKSAIESIDYYNKETPSQKFSSVINDGLESNVVFLEEGKFGLNALLYGMQVPNRKGVLGPPAFPKEFAVCSFDRQSYMTPMFLSDPRLIKIQIENWIERGATSKKPGLRGDSLIAVFQQIKISVDKINARGGQVLFVRPPSSGGYLAMEKIVYPRNQYWDALLTYTNTPGIYYADYPETANLVCPEWSHLKPSDAIIYTENLVRILQDEKGWKFKKTMTP
jgi:hypothetical protein